MKTSILLILSCFLSSGAFAADTVSLYAQGCIPYSENNTLYFNCAKQETIQVEMKDVGQGDQRGDWVKTLQIGSSQLILMVEVQKITSSSGTVTPIVTGTIQSSDGTELVTATDILSSSTSMSLSSLTHYGDKKGFPT